MPNKTDFSPPPSIVEAGLPAAWLKWFESIFTRVGSGPLKITGYDVSNLPNPVDWGNSSANTSFSSLIFIYNESGGATVAFSDGTSWLRVQDRAIVS